MKKSRIGTTGEPNGLEGVDKTLATVQIYRLQDSLNGKNVAKRKEEEQKQRERLDRVRQLSQVGQGLNVISGEVLKVKLLPMKTLHGCNV